MFHLLTLKNFSVDLAQEVGAEPDTVGPDVVELDFLF